MADKPRDVPSNVVDFDDPKRNMYGCAPCPKCKSAYRAAYHRTPRLTIECDDCGHRELAATEQW